MKKKEIENFLNQIIDQQRRIVDAITELRERIIVLEGGKKGKPHDLLLFKPEGSWITLK